MAMPTVERATIEGTSVVVLREPDTGSEVQVVDEVGSNIARFQTAIGGRVVEVLAAAPSMAILRERPTRWGTAVLFPYPGRIENGRFSFRGRVVTLPTDPRDGHAIHGVARARAWEVVATGADLDRGAWVTTRLATARAGIPAAEWPWPFTLSLTTSLRRGVLRVEAEVVNEGGEAMPFGLGFHPYFPTPLGPLGEPAGCAVWVDADEIWEQAGAGLPTGQVETLGPTDGLRQPRRLGDIPTREVAVAGQGRVRNMLFRRRAAGAPDSTRPDAADASASPRAGAADTPDGRRPDAADAADASADGIRAGVIDEQNGVAVTLTGSADFDTLVFFTPAAPPLVSLEPHTCVPNAVNLAEQTDRDTGRRVLDPGAAWHGWFEIAARAL